MTPSIFVRMSKSMKSYVEEFNNQLKEALEIAAGFSMEETPAFDKILICGLGGSGIGATIVAELLNEEATVPILACKDYRLPSFVDDQCLVIACSYSGNTEETLEALESAVEAGAKIACITSGGKLFEMATENNWPCIQLVPGFPPRAAFGYSLVQLLRMMECLGQCSANWKNQVTAAMNLLQSEGEHIQSMAMEMAKASNDKWPLIYSDTWLNGVGVRWRQQVNENAKRLGSSDVFPELNHNALVGWRGDYQKVALIMLKSSHDHARVSKRMELCSEVFRKHTGTIFSIEAKGESKIEQALYLINVGDWYSVYIAELNDTDAVEVDVIDWLKGELAKF